MPHYDHKKTINALFDPIRRLHPEYFVTIRLNKKIDSRDQLKVLRYIDDRFNRRLYNNSYRTKSSWRLQYYAFPEGRCDDGSYHFHIFVDPGLASLATGRLNSFKKLISRKFPHADVYVQEINSLPELRRMLEYVTKNWWKYHSPNYFVALRNKAPV